VPRTVLSRLPLFRASRGQIATYRPDIKLLLCLRPPVDMIYSWSGTRTRESRLCPIRRGDDGKPLLRDLDFRTPSRPYLEGLPRKTFWLFNSMPSGDPDRVRQEITNFWRSQRTSNRDSLKRRTRAAPRFLLLQSSAQVLYAGSPRCRAGKSCYTTSPDAPNRLSPINTKPTSMSPRVKRAPQVGDLLCNG